MRLPTSHVTHATSSSNVFQAESLIHTNFIHAYPAWWRDRRPHTSNVGDAVNTDDEGCRPRSTPPQRSDDGEFTVTFSFLGAAPEPLVRFLFTEHRAFFISHGHCKRLIGKGKVTIDGVVATSNSVITPGSVVSFQPTHEVRTQGGLRRVVYFERVPVVMQNEQWAVVVKPPGVPMDASSASEREAEATVRSLAAMLPYTLSPTAAVDALPVPVAVHRLDHPVGGLVAVAKTRAAARRLAALFRSRQVAKTYIALLAGSPHSPTGQVAAPIDGKPSLSRYRVVHSQPSPRFGTVSKVELVPHTGRTHQLRRHCAEGLGCPIIGDTRYGGERVRCGQALYLFAAGLSLADARATSEVEACPAVRAGTSVSDDEFLSEDDDDNARDEKAVNVTEHRRNAGYSAQRALASEPSCGDGALRITGRFAIDAPTKFEKLLERDQRAHEFFQSGRGRVHQRWGSGAVTVGSDGRSAQWNAHAVVTATGASTVRTTIKLWCQAP